MIIRIFYAALSLILLNCVNAEGQKHPQFRYLSLDAGLNMAGVHSGSQFDRHKKNFGANIGLSGNYSFCETRSIGASLAFEQKGAVDNVFDINTNLNYLSLPIYFQWITGKDPRLFITTGAYTAWLVNATERGEYFDGGQTVKVNDNVSDDFRPLDYGLIIGAGMMVRLYDDFDFSVAFRGSAGLSDIATRSGNKPKNYHFSISLGYIYYIGFR